MFDGQRLMDYECPEKYEMEDDDQTDCHYNPAESRRAMMLTADKFTWGGWAPILRRLGGI